MGAISCLATPRDGRQCIVVEGERACVVTCSLVARLRAKLKEGWGAASKCLGRDTDRQISPRCVSWGSMVEALAGAGVGAPLDRTVIVLGRL